MLDLVRTTVCLCVVVTAVTACEEKSPSPPPPPLRLFSFISFIPSLPLTPRSVADGTATHTAWARNAVQLRLKEKTEDGEAERKRGVVYALVAGLKAPPPPTLPPLKISVAAEQQTHPGSSYQRHPSVVFDYSGINLHLRSSLSGHWALISWRQCDPREVK